MEKKALLMDDCSIDRLPARTELDYCSALSHTLGSFILFCNKWGPASANEIHLIKNHCDPLNSTWVLVSLIIAKRNVRLFPLWAYLTGVHGQKLPRTNSEPLFTIHQTGVISHYRIVSSVVIHLILALHSTDHLIHCNYRPFSLMCKRSI